MNTETLAKASAILSEPFPRDAIKTRTGGGGKRLAYVEAHTVIRRLNRLWELGVTWDWTITHESVKAIGSDELMVVRGLLTIDGMGCREGYGVQRISANGGEDLVKGASSDALKKAATLFGVGLDLYGPDYEEEEPRRQEPPKAVERVRAREAAPVVEDAPVSPLEAAMRAFAAEAGAQILASPDDPNSRPSKSKMMRLAAEVTGGLVCESPQDWNKATAALMRRKETAIGGVD